MRQLKDVYLTDGIRTAIGKFGGGLSTLRADDMMAETIKVLINKNPNLDPQAIEDVIIGCANQAGEDNRNVARMAVLLSGLPKTIGGETVNRLCASGLSAAMTATHAIRAGMGEVFIAGGVENMTRAPWVLSKTSKPFGRDMELYDTSFGWRFINPGLKELYGVDTMGETAENVATMYNISRNDQDKFAYESQQKVAAAENKRRFAEERYSLSIPRPGGKGEAIRFDSDEFAKPATTIDALSRLKSAFRKDGTVTAGNSSGLNDGAAAVLLATENAAHQYHLKPIVRIVASAVAGVEPRIMGIGPVPASEKALQRAGLTLKDMDIIEINEAFAAQVLACTRSLGLEDNDPRINPNGGAIALGHPLGMSGTRILLTAALELQLQKKKYALVSMCVGVGQGYAVVIERV